MRLHILIIALLSALLTLASPNANNSKREATIASNSASEFSSAASQLISLYLLPSVQSALVSVARSAGGITTGDITAAVDSALTAVSPPAWLTAVPSEYSANLVSLESAVSALRGYASAGSISGAPKVVTSTGSGGTVVVSTSFPPSVNETSTSVNGTSALSTAAGNSTSTSTSSSRTSAVTATHLGSSSSSRGFAQATQAPVVAGMGVLGLLGVIAAL